MGDPWYGGGDWTLAGYHVQPHVQLADQVYGVHPNDVIHGVRHHVLPEVRTAVVPGYSAVVPGYPAVVPGYPAVAGDPNMVWDEARGGYWVRETIHDETPVPNQIYGQGGGRIIKTTEWTEPEPENDVMVVRKVKKTRKVVESSDEEPEVVVVPVYYVPVPQPPPCEPKRQPTGFFPLVRDKPFKMETQARGAYMADQCCNRCNY